MSDSQKDPTPTHGAPDASPPRVADATPHWRATPELDVYEGPNEYRILLDVPGASPESVDVQVLRNELQVRAQSAPSPLYGDVARVAFERRLELPSEVDATSASAKLRDGVLEIQIQKAASARRVKVPVNAN